MPPNQDRYEVSLDLVTIADTEHTMQANLTQYEDVAELEDDILLSANSFWFGCLRL